MYDLKAKQQEEQESSNDQDTNSYNNNLYDRSYYKNHFTNDTWATKTSFVPNDSLF